MARPIAVLFAVTAAVTFLALPLAAFVALGDEKDYTNVPPEPQAMQDKLGAFEVTLDEAIALACKDTEGRASSAQYLFAGPQPVIEVVTYGGGKGWNCRIDPASGALRRTEITKFIWPGEPVTGEWVTTPSGLKYTELKVGDGAQPKGKTSTVKVHYSGYLLDGTRFDSSVQRNMPAEFPLNGVIAGWTEGVGSMRVGGKRKLAIPYALGYGERGNPGRIPPKATLVFDVELLEIVKD